MSVATKRLPLAKVDDLVARMIPVLSPACERIEVAGSVRRRSPLVGDLELVAIPRVEEVGLWSGAATASALDRVLDELVAANKLTPVKGGDRFKQFMVGRGDRSITLDLWIVTAETWGVQFAIRTGSADFARSLVRTKSYGGRLNDGLVVREGRVWRASEVITGMIDAENYRGPFFDSNGATPMNTPEETDFLALAGGWVAPENRS